jgi:hypothetical protein
MHQDTTFLVLNSHRRQCCQWIFLIRSRTEIRALQSTRKRLLDARIQNRLAARLRLLKEEDASRHIRRLVALDAKVGLRAPATIALKKAG